MGDWMMALPGGVAARIKHFSGDRHPRRYIRASLSPGSASPQSARRRQMPRPTIKRARSHYDTVRAETPTGKVGWRAYLVFVWPVFCYGLQAHLAMLLWAAGPCIQPFVWRHNLTASSAAASQNGSAVAFHKQLAPAAALPSRSLAAPASGSTTERPPPAILRWRRSSTSHCRRASLLF